ncbi:uncharacterized protein EV420DRAFT_1745180 [Desarmillaria tabescens]|uniref:Uncharacterized protein n=1 Tax=Armillaria tabescens TaxID=1929756 RepID=A0AA39NDT1_ARMTA|nr:uncharacterized protein EV420DRAFT_1745180 [Desarmillaria tabescens]KAK0463628.1 hypothetical protein EV420DRAFT_1745180 [Desarmillaria tabescens]
MVATATQAGKGSHRVCRFVNVSYTGIRPTLKAPGRPSHIECVPPLCDQASPLDPTLLAPVFPLLAINPPAAYLATFPASREIAYAAIPNIPSLAEPLQTETIVGIAGAGFLFSLLMKEVEMVGVVDETYALQAPTEKNNTENRDVEKASHPATSHTNIIGNDTVSSYANFTIRIVLMSMYTYCLYTIAITEVEIAGPQ